MDRAGRAEQVLKPLQLLGRHRIVLLARTLVHNRVLLVALVRDDLVWAEH